MNIHPTSIISPTARISEDAQIGPYVLIEDNVHIGRGAKIYSHAHILAHTTVGDNCEVHIGAVLGHIPQIRAHKDESGKLHIGNNNIFREYTTLHRASKPDAITTVGNDNYFMGFSHIAHDCAIGNNVTICNGALIAGHVRIEDNAFLSGNVTVHQFCRIGKLAMIGGLARVSKDVPPYMLVKGDSTVWAINSIGLRRAGFSPESRVQIKNAFRLLYKSNLNIKQALEQIKNLPEKEEHITHLISFIAQSRRGICSYKAASLGERLQSFLSKSKTLGAYDLFKKERKNEK